MISQKAWGRRMGMTILIGSVVLWGMGCGHRVIRSTSYLDEGDVPGQAVNGVPLNLAHAVSNKTNSTSAIASQMKGAFPLSPDEGGAAQGDMGEAFGQPGDQDTLKGLSEEPLSEDDPVFRKNVPGDSAQRFWDQRQQAELVSTQVGIHDVYFGFDSWRLTNQAKQTLIHNADWLKRHPEVNVTIEGHCDERGTSAYNYVLGEKRATKTHTYLLNLGVSPSQLTVMSYGKDNPVCMESTEGCYHKNRRAHLVLGIKVASVSRGQR